MWHHRFYTAWAYNFVRFGALYSIWYLAPSFDNVATFVALNTAMNSLGKALQSLAEDALTVVISTAKIEELSRLLNYETDETKSIKKDHMIPLDYTYNRYFEITYHFYEWRYCCFTDAIAVLQKYKEGLLIHSIRMGF